MDYSKLRSIEYEKFSVSKFTKQVIMANIGIAAMVLMTAIMNHMAGPGNDLPITTFMMIDSLVKSVFIIWQAVLLSLLIIEEYQSGTVLLLFSYPLERKKVIRVKLLMTATLIFSAMVLSQVFQNVLFYLLDMAIPEIGYSVTLSGSAASLFTTVTSIMMGMIPLYVGMQQKSTIAAVISSILIVSITVSSSTKTGTGLIMILPVALLLGIAGTVTTVKAVDKMLSEDIIV